MALCLSSVVALHTKRGGAAFRTACATIKEPADDGEELRRLLFISSFAVTLQLPPRIGLFKIAQCEKENGQPAPEPVFQNCAILNRHRVRSALSWLRLKMSEREGV